MLSHSRCQLFTYIISIFTFKVSLQEGVIPHLQWRELRVREISWCVLWQADNWMSEQEGGALALHAAVCCAPCPGHRTGAVCLPSLPWCGFSAGCRSTRLNPTGRRQGLPEALSPQSPNSIYLWKREVQTQSWGLLSSSLRWCTAVSELLTYSLAPFLSSSAPSPRGAGERTQPGLRPALLWATVLGKCTSAI